jgi:hypothetical protein
MSRFQLARGKSAHWLVAFLAIALITVPARAFVLVDFESIPTGNPNANFLAAYGISSVITTGGVGDNVYDSTGDPTFVPASGTRFYWPSAGAFPSPTGIFTTDFTFTYPVNYFSFYKIGVTNPTFGMAGWRAQAFDASNNVVATEDHNLSGGLDYPPPPTPTYYLLSGANPITKVIYSINYNYQSTTASAYFDDFQFDPVPEPTTIALLPLAAAFLRRRRA